MADWTATGTAFEQPPVGSHLATLIRIVDLGTQEGEYKGEKTVKKQVLFTWELPEELRDDDQPYIISKFYTASIGEKANLTRDLTSWFGKAPEAPFTIEKRKALLGQSCNIVVSQRDKSDKRVVSAVIGLGKKDKAPDKSHNPLVFFDLDDYDEAVFDGLSEGIQKMIMKSPEYANIMNGGSPDEVQSDNDEIPF